MTIYVEPPSGTATRFSWDNEAFTLNQERTFSGFYRFASAGTYTVYAEVYDNMGQQSGWNSDNRFGQRIETFTVRERVTVQFSPSSYTVNEDDGSVDITVTLGESLSSAAEVRLSGYLGEVETVTFPANTTSQTTSLTIINIPGVGRTESSFTLRLGTSDSRLGVNTATATLTVVDDDEVTVGFDRRNYTVQEGARRFYLGLRLTDPRVACPANVPFNVNFSYTDPDGAIASGPTSLVFSFLRCHRARVVSFQLTNDNIVEETSEAVFTLDSVSSDSPGVANRVKLDPSTATLSVIDSSDRATVAFEHRAYSVTEGDSVELCAVLTYNSVAFPFTVNLSYPDELISGPTSFSFGALDTKSCGEFQTHDDDVSSRTFTMTFRLTRPSDLDRRIRISSSRASLTVYEDDPPSATVSVTVATNPSGRTVTVDGTNRTAPYTTTWNSGSSHTLDVPSPQSVSGGRYTFSSWSHGGSKTQTVSPTSDMTYTANFTFQPDPTSHPPAAVGVSPLPPFQQDVSLISGFTQTFVARASDQDGNISEWEWFVDDVSRSRLSFALTGIVTSQVNIQFIKPGSHTVKATFTDSTGLSDSFSWEVEVRGPNLTTCPGESGTARRGSVPYDGEMVNLSLTGVAPVRGAPEPEVHLC